jgi:hypothetical protein
MSWKLVAAAIGVILVAAAVVQRGYVSALDKYEPAMTEDLQQLADGGGAAAERGLAAARGYATGLAATGTRVRILADGRIVVDGARGAPFISRPRAESSAVMPDGDEVLVVVNRLTGAGAPSGMDTDPLRDELVRALWGGAGIAALGCLALALVTVARRRRDRGPLKNEEGREEGSDRTGDGTERGALRA